MADPSLPPEGDPPFSHSTLESYHPEPYGDMDQYHRAAGARPQSQHQYQLPQNSGTSAQRPPAGNALANSGALPAAYSTAQAAQPAPSLQQHRNIGSLGNTYPYMPSEEEAASPTRPRQYPSADLDDIPPSRDSHWGLPSAWPAPIPFAAMSSGSRHAPRSGVTAGSLHSQTFEEVDRAYEMLRFSGRDADRANPSNPPRTSRRRSFSQFARDNQANPHQPMDGFQAPRPGPPRAPYSQYDEYEARLMAQAFQARNDLQALAQAQAQARRMRAQTSERLLNFATLFKGPYTVASLRRKLQRMPYSHELDLDAQRCEVCDKPYKWIIVDPTENAENAIKLTCGHIFGEWCLIQWLTTCEEDNNKVTCPMCRDPLLQEPPRLPFIPTVEQLTHLPKPDQVYLLSVYRAHRYRCDWHDFEERHRPAGSRDSSGTTEADLEAEAQAWSAATETVRRLASARRQRQRRPPELPQPSLRNPPAPVESQSRMQPATSTLQDLSLPPRPERGAQAAEHRLQSPQVDPWAPVGGMIADTQRYHAQVLQTQGTQEAQYPSTP